MTRQWQRWTEEEDNRLRDLWPLSWYPVSAIALALGRGEQTCRMRAAKLGLHRPRHERRGPMARWTAAETETLSAALRRGMYPREAAALLARTELSVQHKVRQMGRAVWGLAPAQQTVS